MVYDAFLQLLGKRGWFIHFGFATLDGAQPQKIVLGI
jgi:hypothetical protein